MKSLSISKTNFKNFFSLYHTLNSDQCLSDQWSFLSPNRYTTFLNIKGKWVKISLQETEKELFVESNKELSELEIETLKNELLYQFWAEYDLMDFYEKFSKEKYMSKVISFGFGMRVMRDLDPIWRIVESICTQNSSIKQIRQMEELLCRYYGTPIKFDDGTLFYSPPSVEKLANATEEELKKCKVGYRANYLIEVARAILNNVLDPSMLFKMPTEEARKVLLGIKGIGSKVSDLILLYGFGKPDVFPIDIWVKRALSREYFKGKEVSVKQLREFALDYFGQHAGIGHLYIFYYERKSCKM